MTRLFASDYLAGFECSSHRRADGRRLDLIASTFHDQNAEDDYAAVARLGLRTARDGVRWHLIENTPGRYDWSSLLPMLQAARRSGVQVIWDLCHYGLPDHLDVWAPSFPDHFARFAAAAARVVAEHTDREPVFCPINEISFWAWAGGDMGRFHPVVFGRGGELKRQLTRAAIAAIRAIRAAVPKARFITAEPLINVQPNGHDDRARLDAVAYHAAQFEALDMLAGAIQPDLGGSRDLLDVIGVNYYPDNQWYLGGNTIPLGHHAYRPLRNLLEDVWARYRRPILLAETGAEGSAKPSWLHYVAREVRAARRTGVLIEGVCLYPILDYPGWENGRICDVGLFSAAPPRAVCTEFADQLRAEQAYDAELARQSAAVFA